MLGYLDLCRELVSRAEKSVLVLKKRGNAHAKMDAYVWYAPRQMNQVDRRLVQGEPELNKNLRFWGLRANFKGLCPHA